MQRRLHTITRMIADAITGPRPSECLAPLATLSRLIRQNSPRDFPAYILSPIADSLGETESFLPLFCEKTDGSTHELTSKIIILNESYLLRNTTLADRIRSFINTENWNRHEKPEPLFAGIGVEEMVSIFTCVINEMRFTVRTSTYTHHSKSSQPEKPEYPPVPNYHDLSTGSSITAKFFTSGLRHSFSKKDNTVKLRFTATPIRTTTGSNSFPIHNVRSDDHDLYTALVSPERHSYSNLMLTITKTEYGPRATLHKKP